MTRVEDVIQTYIHTGSIKRTAKSTGYSQWKVRSILIKAHKYTPQERVWEILRNVGITINRK